MKKAAFFDFDKTLFSTYAIFPFVDFLEKKGFLERKQKDEYYRILKDYKQGKRGYELTVRLLLKKIAKHIESRQVSLIDSLSKAFAEKNRDLFFPFASDLVDLLRRGGYKNVVISGEPNFIIKYLAIDFLRIKKLITTNYEEKGKKYTGKITRFLDYKSEKEKEIKKIALKQKIDLSKSLAFGDSEGDMAMLALVGYPLAVNPSKGLRKLAVDKGWMIVNKSDT